MMTNDSLCTRRRMLQLTGSATVLGLAGCSGGQANDGAGESGPTDDDHSDGGDDHDDSGDDHDDGDEQVDDAGHADEEHGHGSVGDPTETAEVAVNTTDDGEAHFNPHVTRVENGGTLTWVLESGAHTATAYHPENDEPQLVPDGADSWASGMLSEEGEQFEHTFETEGVYHYYCVPHEGGGMIGSVIVGEPDPHDQPALEEPPEDKPAAVREKIQSLNEMCNEALGDSH